MPVGIGVAASTFTNPIGLMSDCHRRIERFLKVLLIVTQEAEGKPLSLEQRSGLAAALKYFREAAPRHTADEEEDLFPALRRSAQPGVSQILERVQRLETDHKMAAEWHAEVDEAGERWLSQNHLPAEEVSRLKDALLALSTLYQAHIEVEDREIFPLAQQELTKSEKEAMGRRMASRRGVPFLPAFEIPTNE